MIETYNRVNKMKSSINKMIQYNDFHNMFTLSTNVTRGHNFKLSKDHNRLDVRKNSFSQRVVNTWNSLKYETHFIPKNLHS